MAEELTDKLFQNLAGKKLEDLPSLNQDPDRIATIRAESGTKLAAEVQSEVARKFKSAGDVSPEMFVAVIAIKENATSMESISAALNKQLADAREVNHTDQIAAGKFEDDMSAIRHAIIAQGYTGYGSAPDPNDPDKDQINQRVKDSFKALYGYTKSWSDAEDLWNKIKNGTLGHEKDNEIGKFGWDDTIAAIKRVYHKDEMEGTSPLTGREFHDHVAAAVLAIRAERVAAVKMAEEEKNHTKDVDIQALGLDFHDKGQMTAINHGLALFGKPFGYSDPEKLANLEPSELKLMMGNFQKVFGPGNDTKTDWIAEFGGAKNLVAAMQDIQNNADAATFEGYKGALMVKLNERKAQLAAGGTDAPDGPVQPSPSADPEAGAGAGNKPVPVTASRADWAQAILAENKYTENYEHCGIDNKFKTLSNRDLDHFIADYNKKHAAGEQLDATNGINDDRVMKALMEAHAAQHQGNNISFEETIKLLPNGYNNERDEQARTAPTAPAVRTTSASGPAAPANGNDTAALAEHLNFVMKQDADAFNRLMEGKNVDLLKDPTVLTDPKMLEALLDLGKFEKIREMSGALKAHTLTYAEAVHKLDEFSSSIENMASSDPSKLQPLVSALVQADRQASPSKN